LRTVRSTQSIGRKSNSLLLYKTTGPSRARDWPIKANIFNRAFCKGSSAAIAELIEHMNRAKTSYAKKNMTALPKKTKFKELTPRNEKSPGENF
jgi:hypothetical protein